MSSASAILNRPAVHRVVVVSGLMDIRDDLLAQAEAAIVDGWLEWGSEVSNFAAIVERAIRCERDPQPERTELGCDCDECKTYLHRAVS